MQTAIIKSLGYKLTKSVPATEAEFDKLAGRVGACVDEANKNIIYRAVLADFRPGFLHGIEADESKGIAAVEGLDKLTGIERKTRVTKPAVVNAEGVTTSEAVEVWDETEDEFVNRVWATLAAQGKYPSEDAAREAFAGHAQLALDNSPFDPSKTERKSAGPKKTPATYLEVAKEIVAATGSIEAACAAFTRKTGITPAAVTVEALGASVWADQKAQKAKIANAYANA